MTVSEDVTLSSASRDEEEETHDDQRARPHGFDVRSKTTYNPNRTSKKTLEAGAIRYPTLALAAVSESHPDPDSYEELVQIGVKPKSYSTCEKTGMGTTDKPCPFVSCKAHLALEVRGNSLVVCAPHRFSEEDGRDPVPEILFENMEETCAFRLMEEPHTLEAIGLHLGLTRERIRQIEHNGMKAAAEYLGDEEMSLLSQRIAHGNTPDCKQLLGSLWQIRDEMKRGNTARNASTYAVIAVRENKVVELACVSRAQRRITRMSIENLKHRYALSADGNHRFSAFFVYHWLMGLSA